MGGMKAELRSILSVVFLFTALNVQAARRELSQVWRMEAGQQQQMPVKFFQAESVRLNFSSTQGNQPVDLSGTNTVVVWEINGWNDYTNTYAVSTGTVGSVSNQVIFELTPEQSNLPAGTYLGFVRALQQQGETLSQVAVLAWQTIAVEWAPDSRLYSLVGPLTFPPAYDAATLDAISNAVFGAVSEVSGQVSELDARLETVEVYGDHAAAGYASESDQSALDGRVTTVEAYGDHRQAGYASTGDVAAVAADLSAAGETIAGLEASKLDAAVFAEAVETATDVITQFVGQVEGQISNLQTNPPAAGPEGSVQMNLGGKLSGSSNVYFSAEHNAVVMRNTNSWDLIRYYHGITNPSQAADSNLIIRVKNNVGKGQVELANRGNIGVILRGDGYGQFRSLSLGGTVRTNWLELDPVAMPIITGLKSGSTGFDGLRLDRKIEAWDEIGITYTNAVRINNPITVTNTSAWTGWTTTGSLTAQNEILLLDGQYLLSPVQPGGVARYDVESYSSQNGTPVSIKLMVGTNEVVYPYTGPDAQLKITAGEPMPGSTAGLYVSAVTLVGYEYPADAGSPKYVASLRRTDYEDHEDDLTSRRYVDSARAAAEKHADTGLAVYAADPSKNLTGDSLSLGNYTVVGAGAWRGINFSQAGDSATIGTRFNDQIISLESGLSVVEIQGLQNTENTATIDLYAQNIIGDPIIMVTTNLVTGTWIDANAAITDLGGGYYTATVDTSGFGSSGFFRAWAEKSPVSAGAVTIHADELKLDGNRITGVAEIVFTNGWRIACTINGLEFIQPE